MIRRAVLSDLDQVAALIGSSFDSALVAYMVYAQHGTAAFLAAYVTRPDLAPDRTLLVSFDDIDGQMTGFAEFRALSEDHAHLSYICVEPRARGTGVAQALIEHFLACAGRPLKIDLYVFADNVPALALYRKLGFLADGETQWFVRNLPAANAGESITVTNWPVASAAFKLFGFSELQIVWRGRLCRIGQIGAGVLRCFDKMDFEDTDLLGRLAAAFPDAREALMIAESGAAPARSINRSVRLAAVL